jgi:flagellin
MGLKVNTNMDALIVHDNLITTNNSISNSLRRLSSGLRVGSAKDDAAGFSIANAFKAKIAAMQVASQNAGEAQSMLQTADGAYSQINDILVRMKSLATQAASGQTDLTAMGGEFGALQNEIDRIANSTKYGSQYLTRDQSHSDLATSATGITFQVGAMNAAENQITISFSGATAACLGVSTNTVGISSLASAQAAMTALDTALTSVNSYMGSVGSYQNRLQYTINNLTTSIENYTSSQSTIQDVDMAAEVSSFTKNQILQQTGMAMLAQANSAPQAILSLLK